MSDADRRDRRAWLSSILIGVAFAAAAMGFSLGGGFGLFGDLRAWFVPGDIWMVVEGGRFVWDGALGYVYQGTHSYSLPLSFIVVAPASGAMDHFRLLEGSPFPISYPSGWLLIGPYTSLLGIVLLHATRRLAWDLGVQRRLWALQLAATVVVLVPSFEWGHPEDVLALAFTLYFARSLLRGGHLRAAIYLAVAISFKQWAVLLVPLAIGCAPSGRRLKVFAAATALPAAFTAFVLAVDFPDASKALFSPVTTLKGSQGHVAVFGAFLGSHTSAVTRLAAVVLAGAVGWRLRRFRSPAAVLGGMALVLTIRPLAEPVSFTYYWAPGLLLAGLALAASERRVTLWHWVTPVLAIAWATPRANPRTVGWWWTGELLLLAVTGVLVIAISPYFRQFDPVRRHVKVGGGQPIVNAMSTPAGPGDTSWTP